MSDKTNVMQAWNELDAKIQAGGLQNLTPQQLDAITTKLNEIIQMIAPSQSETDSGEEQ